MNYVARLYELPIYVCKECPNYETAYCDYYDKAGNRVRINLKGFNVEDEIHPKCPLPKLEEEI